MASATYGLTMKLCIFERNWALSSGGGLAMTTNNGYDVCVLYYILYLSKYLLTYTHIYSYILIYTHIYSYILIYTHISTYPPIHPYIYIHILIHIPIHIHTNIHHIGCWGG
jgi:hypothetical protein